MILDYNPQKRLFYWHGKATKADLDRALELGLDYSTTASKNGKRVWLTPHKYAAVTLWDDASNEARFELALIKGEIDASHEKEWSGTRIALPDDQELMPYQSAGVNYALRRSGVLIGDQPGLGKTAQAIAIANEMRAKRILVVCPAAVRLQWPKEIKRFALGDTRCYPIIKTSNGVSPLARWTIISYDLARGTLLPSLRREKWDLVIMDEAHSLKTPSAARTQAMFGKTEHRDGSAHHIEGIAENVGKVVALTGTPLPNRPRECYTLARGLDHGCIDYLSEDGFSERFNPASQYGEQSGRLPELYARLRSHIMVRRMKRDVLTQLPPVRYEIEYVEETGAVKAALHAESMLEFDPDSFDSRVPIDGEVSTVRREMGLAKAPHVVDRVKMMLEGGVDKLVLFGWHREVLDIWGEKLQKFNPVRIDGSTSSKGKEAAKHKFINDPDCRLIYGNMLSMGVGTDGLQKVANVLVVGENSWVPGDNQQAVDRLDRFGQEDSVLALFLVAQGSIDERIVSQAAKKTIITHKALDAG